jgi:hypothetical protein
MPAASFHAGRLGVRAPLCVPAAQSAPSGPRRRPQDDFGFGLSM